MKNFSTFLLVLFLGVWTSNHAASELNSFAENTNVYDVNDCSFEEKLLVTNPLFFVDIPVEGSLTIYGCTMTYDITVSYSILSNKVTRVRGNLSFSGSCSGSVDFDIELNANRDGTINELPVFDKADVNYEDTFERHLVNEINQAIITS